MTMSNLAGNWRRALLPIVVGAAAMALAACSGGGVTDSGGGGPSVAATPYVLFASNYVAYDPGPVNDAFLHSVQDGDVYTGFCGKFDYGGYSSPQPDMDRTQLYLIQFQVKNSACQDGDFVYLAIKAPGTNTLGPTITTPVDIGQSNTLLIQMGNTVSGSHANVFTVDLTNNNFAEGSGETAKCSIDQTLTAVGADTFESALGAINYAIKLNDLTCSVGTLATLKSTGVTAVAIVVKGVNNPGVVANELNTIAVGYVGFSKQPE
jgi:hypothetical protein